MAETDAPGVQTMTLSEFARRREIDAELLKLLARGGHISTIPTRNGSHRFPVDSPLTAELAEEKGRAVYNELLETAGQLVIKARHRMTRVLEEIEEQLNHVHNVVTLGPGLEHATDSLLGRDDHGSHLLMTLYELTSWHEVLYGIDEMHRFHAQRHPDADKPHGTAATRSPAPWSNPAWWEGQTTALADELPDGVDDLSPEARRTVLDLLRVLVVAESGGTAR
jgi:hypothetical protein